MVPNASESSSEKTASSNSPSNEATRQEPNLETVQIPQQDLPEGQQPSGQEPEEPFYFFEDPQSPDFNAAFATPFQLSGQISPMPPAGGESGYVAQASASTAPPVKPARRFPKVSIATIAIVVCFVVLIGALSLNAFAAQGAPALQKAPVATTVPTATHPQQPQKPTVPPNPTPTVVPEAPGGQGQPSTWIPQQLPAGWQNAGLQTVDAIQAQRTANAFTDREETLDFRNIGTRGEHSGTMTAALFILSPAAKNRFQQNDVRVINNTLFDHLKTMRLIQTVVAPVPRLVKFQVQGQQQFAWVDVSFQLFQSQSDPNNTQQRIERLEVDPATNQPRIHVMSVLLVRIQPEGQGTNAPMGGTGWLVSNYGLDQPNMTPVDIVQPA